MASSMSTSYVQPSGQSPTVLTFFPLPSFLDRYSLRSDHLINFSAMETGYYNYILTVSRADIRPPMHRSVYRIVRIAARILVAGASLLAPARVSANQDLTKMTVYELPPADPEQSAPVTQQNDAPAKSNAPSVRTSKKQSLYRAWRKMAEREEASEPDWLSPLATTSGRIKNELRYDMWRQTTPSGTTIYTFAGGKGLEFIAAPRVQLLLGIPSYVDHFAASPPDGFGDLPLMLKFRVASANASQGNYLVTFLLSATVPTGSRANGLGEAVLTPTLALGKGWRKFDVQTTFGVNLPAAETQRLGKQLLWNTTFQYRARWKLWPELEVNSTYFEQGPNAGKTQTFLTPGLDLAGCACSAGCGSRRPPECRSPSPAFILTTIAGCSRYAFPSKLASLSISRRVHKFA